jgi:hypothetical protein
MNATPTTRTRLSTPFPLALVCLLVPTLASDASAQSDAATVSATVTVQTNVITVAGIQDLSFGTHFASVGIVTHELPAVWQVETGGFAQNVDFVLTQLPSVLDNGEGDVVPLNYGPKSFAVPCGGVTIQADPAVGVQDCFLEPTLGPNVFLGLVIADDGTELIEADLSGATGGTYTGTLELTATLD